MPSKNGINIARLEIQIQDLKEHLDKKFNDLESIQNRNCQDFDYLYKITNKHSDRLSRHSVYVIVGSAIIAVLVKLMIDIYQMKGGI